MAFTDDFTESTDTALESHTPSGGTAWTLQSGSAASCTVKSSNDTLRVTATSAAVYTCDDQGSANHYTQMDFTRRANSLYTNSYICVRLVDASNFIGVRQTTFGNLSLDKVVAGAVTQLVGFTHNNGDTIKIEASGTTIKVYNNGVQQGTDQTVTDHQTETSQGVVAGDSQTNDIWDNFEAGALASAQSPVPIIMQYHNH